MNELQNYAQKLISRLEELRQLKQELISTLEERNQLKTENYDLKIRLSKYEPEVLRDVKKVSKGPGTLIQLVPKFTN